MLRPKREQLEWDQRPRAAFDLTRSMLAASGVSELDFPSPVSSANLISAFLAIAVNDGSIVLKNPPTVAYR